MSEGAFTPSDLIPTSAAIASMGVRVPYWFVPAEDYGPENLVDTYANLAVRMLRVA